MQACIMASRRVILFSATLLLLSSPFGVHAAPLPPEEERVSVQPVAISFEEPGTNGGKVLGVEDVVPSITALSTQKIIAPRRTGTARVTVRGRGFGRADYFRMGNVRLRKQYVNSTTVRLSVPLGRLRYAAYRLQLVHHEKVVAAKRLVIAPAVQTTQN